MRIYEGSARRDFEEVFRSIGADLDARGLREILLLEVDDGFIVTGIAPLGHASWGESVGQLARATLRYDDDAVAQLMDAGLARRGKSRPTGSRPYESALRVVGRYIDETRPRDVFLFEQAGAYVLRLLHLDQTRITHEIVEFTNDDVAGLLGRGPGLRGKPQPTGRR
jgi:hypothetical protein